jgi:hypothetical protein
MLLQSLGHLKGLLYDEGIIIDDPVTFEVRKLIIKKLISIYYVQTNNWNTPILRYIWNFIQGK